MLDPAKVLLTDIRNGDKQAVGRLLDENPELIDARTPEGVSAILFAAYSGRDDIAQLFVDRGKTLCFFEAAAMGDGRSVQQHLEKDSSLLNQFAPDGFTALGLASFFGREEAVAVLIDAGADVRLPSNNPQKVAPLHSASARCHLEITRRLLEAGADPNDPQQQGVTPLHSAANGGCKELVKVLLAAGADPSAKMHSGQTPRDLAAAQGHEEVAALLDNAQATGHAAEA